MDLLPVFIDSGIMLGSSLVCREVDLIRCAMFDFGNVLAHFDTQRWYDFITAHQQPGAMSEFEFFELTEKALGLNVEFEEFFFEFTANIHPDPRMIGLRQSLRQNGIKLAIVSNINRYHFEYVSQKWPEVFTGFDYLALSFKLGIKKPDPMIWKIAAGQLGVKLSECFFIDDLETNILAFERLGGIGHHYNVIDGSFCSNSRLEIERKLLIRRMTKLEMINRSQVKNLER